MSRTFDEQMQDIGRREYGLHHALAGPFRKENGSLASLFQTVEDSPWLTH